MKIKIKAITEKGEKTLKKHIEESKSVSVQKKAMMKMIGIRQTVGEFDPYTVQIEFKNRLLAERLRVEDLTKEITDYMRENETEKDIDYKVEVE